MEEPMAEKFDGVVEAVRYCPDGRVEVVRVYERRGPTWSDRVLISRDELVERLKAGKKYKTGERLPYLAGTFKTRDSLRLVGDRGNEFVVTGDSSGSNDRLEGLPVF
jgi:hypothetical protein